MRSLRPFEVLSQMDSHQARTEAIQEEMKAKMNKIKKRWWQ
jgi:hypothetical protein